MWEELYLERRNHAVVNLLNEVETMTAEKQHLHLAYTVVGWNDFLSFSHFGWRLDNFPHSTQSRRI